MTSQKRLRHVDRSRVPRRSCHHCHRCRCPVFVECLGDSAEQSNRSMSKAQTPQRLSPCFLGLPQIAHVQRAELAQDYRVQARLQ